MMEPAQRSPAEIDAATPPDEVRAIVRAWVEQYVPAAWVEAGRTHGPAGVREVRSFEDYEQWYPTFVASGLVAPTWPREHGGMGLDVATAKLIEAELAPFRLGRLNPLGLYLAAPAIKEHGTPDQQARFLPPIVAAEDIYCQLFSEPGAGSDLASLATTARRDGDDWILKGHKVWTTWADRATMAVLLARTNPDVPKRRGITFFLLEMDQPGIRVEALHQMDGGTEFCEVVLDGARVPDSHRIGAVSEGWKVARATLSGERQMVAGEGSGGVDRIGGGSVAQLVEEVRGTELTPELRSRLITAWCEDRVRQWTNLRVRSERRHGNPGPESSIGKVHGTVLNQQVQMLAVDLMGKEGIAWTGSDGPYGSDMPRKVRGMLRSRANTIEGGTTEVNKNILGERVLGLPREPDPYNDMAWQDVPRS